MKKTVPMFTFDIPISRDVDELKVVDMRMLSEAKDFARRKKRKKKRRTVDDDDEVSHEDENGGEGEDEFLDDDQFTMIDDDFRGAEQYNTHMGRLGSVIRNIEMRERRIRTSLMRKTGREIEREEEIAKEESRKRRVKRKKKKKKKKSGSDAGKKSSVAGKKSNQNEYDLADNFIDDDVYGDYVRMGGSSEEEDDDLIDMGNWIQDDDEENELGYPYTAPEQRRRMSGGKALSSPFQVPPSPLQPGRTEKKRKRGQFGDHFKQPDFIQALTTLENKLEQLKSGGVTRSSFKWDDIADELYGVAVVRGKYFKKVPKKLTEVLVTFPILCEFTEGTIRKNLRDMYNYNVVAELDRIVQENTVRLKRLILAQFQLRLSTDINLGPVPDTSDPTFLSLVREKKLKVQWDNQTNILFFQVITDLREAVEKTNNLKKKKGKFSLRKRVLVDEVHNKYGEIKIVMPNDKDLSFVQKYKELEEYFQQNPGLLPTKKKEKKSRRGRKKKVSPLPPTLPQLTTFPQTTTRRLSPPILMLQTQPQPPQQQQPPQLPVPQIPLLNIPISNIGGSLGGFNTQYLMAALNTNILPRQTSSASTSLTVTPLATPPIPKFTSDSVVNVIPTSTIQQLQQQRQQQLPSLTNTTSLMQPPPKKVTTPLHNMALRKRPEKAFVGEMSPSESRRDGDLLLDDEDEDDNVVEELDELKTPEKRRRSSTASNNNATNKENNNSDEIRPPPPQNVPENVTGKKRKDRPPNEQQQQNLDSVGENEKKKRKIELSVVQ